MGPAVASNSNAGRHDRRALSGRLHRRVPVPRGSRAVPYSLTGAARAIRPDAAPGQNALARICAIRRPEPTSTRVRKTGYLPIPGLFSRVWSEPKGMVHGAMADTRQWFAGH